MRARNIKPGFYKNEKLVECSLAARLLAPGLWMLADKEGRLHDRAKTIKMEIFPADSIDVEPLLQELHIHGHIVRYEMNQVKYIQVLGFKDHQSPHYSEKSSIIPPPFQEYSEKLLSSSDDIPKPLVISPQPQPPDLLNPDLLNPDLLNPDLLNPDTTQNGVRGKIDYSDEFEKFWKSYPKNGASKSEAHKSYQKSLKTGASHADIERSVRAYSAFIDRAGEKIAHATTWLNQQRWTVDYDSQGRTEPNAGQHSQKSTFRSETERIAAGFLTQPEGQSKPDIGIGANMRNAEAVR